MEEAEELDPDEFDEGEGEPDLEDEVQCVPAVASEASGQE